MNNKQIIAQAFQNSSSNKDIVAYHGTSLQCLNEIIKTGKQPGLANDYNNKNLAYRKGDVFFYPISGRTEIRGKEGIYESHEAYVCAKLGARSISGSHFLMEKLGFPFSSSLDAEDMSEYHEISDLVDCLTDNEAEHFAPAFYQRAKKKFRKLLKKRGYTSEKIESLYLEANGKKGIVIGYSNQIFEQDTPLKGDQGHDVCVRNVVIQNIIGIEPEDDEAFEFLDTL